MANFPTTGILWLDILIVSTLTGSVVAAGLTAFTNRLAKRREEYLDMAKYKMDSIFKSKHYFIQMARFYEFLYYQLNGERANFDFMQILYFICNILYLREEVRRSFGAIQLGDLGAENVVKETGDKLLSALDQVYLYEDISRLTDLARCNLPYHVFRTRVATDNIDLLDKLRNWLSNTMLSDELKKSCLCYRQLILFELNHIFKVWYGREPVFKIDITRDIEEYLLKESSKKENQPLYKDYYRRISSFGMSRRQKFFKKLQRK
jgi:hypothetical protein